MEGIWTDQSGTVRFCRQFQFVVLVKFSTKWTWCQFLSSTNTEDEQQHFDTEHVNVVAELYVQNGRHHSTQHISINLATMFDKCRPFEFLSSTKKRSSKMSEKTMGHLILNDFLTLAKSKRRVAILWQNITLILNFHCFICSTNNSMSFSMVDILFH